ncbi:MAG: Gfo/Idh/MocA family oxidoreductase [Acidobacteria bacterium]|nr:Gfo/Idh/MocA family oxidoreductase [Acidobacteriota bacterium]
MNRRDLGKLAGGAALTAASWNRVWGASDRLGMALIGSGRRGTEVMRAFLASGAVDLRCLCDVYDAHREKARHALLPNGPTPFECVAHEEALARPDVDAVLIAAPDHLHVDLARAALAAGKHVYLEKPTTHHFSEGRALLAAVESSGKLLQCGMQQRSGEHYQRAKAEIFANRRLGEVVFVRTWWSNFPWQARHVASAPQPAGLDWDRFLGPAPKRPFDMFRYDSWRCFSDYGGGLLADIMTHWADVAQWMMDESTPSAALTGGGIYRLHDGRDNPDVVNAIVEYQGGWDLTFESTVLPIRETRATVLFLGTAGTLDLSRDGYTFTPQKGAPETVRASRGLEAAHTANFLDAIRNGAPLNAPAEIGIQACNPVHLARTSYRNRQRATWNMVN